ncbi:MAG TPA: hypothetical protein VFP68_07605 [Burkholderiaceae bacterium]|nr:hypothetical protein [Burkholderiaceae bacterium]
MSRATHHDVGLPAALLSPAAAFAGTEYPGNGYARFAASCAASVCLELLETLVGITHAGEGGWRVRT